MKFTPRSGWLLILPDSDEDRTLHGILVPDTRRRKRHSGLCLIHNEPRWQDLTGEHVLFEKWSWREFTLGDTTYWLVPEGNVFATITGDTHMDRDTLIAELTAYLTTEIKDEIKTNVELSEDDVANIQGLVENVSVEALTTDTEEEELEDDEEDKEPGNA